MRSSRGLHIFLICAILLLLEISLPTLAKPVVSKGSAFDDNREAIRLAEAGKLKRSLKFFKLALAADPNNPQYLNNIGVTQMRLGLYEQAKSNFELTLKIQPDNPDANGNLNELKRYAPDLFGLATAPAPLPSNQPQPQQQQQQNSHSNQPITELPESFHEAVKAKLASWRNNNRNVRRSLPRIHYDDLFDVRNQPYLEGKLPMIVTGLFDRYNFTVDQFNPASLAVRYASSTVDFYPHNMAKSNVHPYLTSMAQAIRELQRPTTAFPRDPEWPGTYLQWNMDLDDWKSIRSTMKPIPEAFRFDDIWLHECLPNDQIRNEYLKKLHWRMMLIGNEGAGMFNHVDVLRTASWQIQLEGAKMWHLCGPDQNANMYGAGLIDVWNPDYEKYPRFAQADCFEDTIRKGEFIYYPADYWHQTRNLITPSVSITGTMLDQNNWRIISAELKAQCASNKWNWHFSRELCAALENCYPWFENRFEVEKRTAADLAPDMYFNL